MKTFRLSTRKMTNNQVCEEFENLRSICGFIHPRPLRSPWPPGSPTASPGGPSFTGLTSHAVRSGRCSFSRASVADFSPSISPCLGSCPENNSAAITICCDCGFGATVQHLCPSGKWGAVKETSPVYIPSLRPLNRCSLQHCCPVEALWFLPVKAFIYTGRVCKRGINDWQSVRECDKSSTVTFCNAHGNWSSYLRGSFWIS